MQWYEKSAQQGDAQAQCKFGSDVSIRAKALRKTTRKHSNGMTSQRNKDYVQAQYNLAMMYVIRAMALRKTYPKQAIEMAYLRRQQVQQDLAHVGAGYNLATACIATNFIRRRR